MRLPEKLMGYVEYEGVNYPFNFDKVSFMITLFPPSIGHHICILVPGQSELELRNCLEKILPLSRYTYVVRAQPS